MNTIRLNTLILGALSFLLLSGPLSAQQGRDVIMRAMQDELARSMERLTIEDMSPPFFISYTVIDEHSTRINGVAGGITDFDTSHQRIHDVRLLVGDYQQTQEQFVSMNFGSSMYRGMNTLSLDDDYDAIRRDLWLTTDRKYKEATETLEKKRAAIRQQQIPDALKGLADFAPVEPVTLEKNAAPFTCDAAAWKKKVSRLSAVFGDFPSISVSNVSFHVSDVNRYFVSSEGSRIITPKHLVVLLSTATAQAEDGEVLSDYVIHFADSPDGLPSVDAMEAEIRSMAQKLSSRRNAARMATSYSGPVLFEDQAAAELFVRLFLGDEGLVASRMPVMDGPMAAMSAQMQNRNLGEKMGRRVLPAEVSIVSTPGRDSYDGMPLVGPYAVDAEGVVPADALILIKEGKVEALLADRTPTQHTSASTGHHCIGIGSSISTDGIAPGVLDIRVSEGPSSSAMKEELIQRALDEGLEHAFIIRKIRPETVPAPPVDTDFSARFSMFGMSAGGASAPLGDVIGIYRVSTKDGNEELMRNIEVMEPSSSPLRRCLVSKDRKAWNTSIPGGSAVPGMGALLSFSMSMGGSFGGIPTSIIAPRAVIVDDMEIREEKRPITPKPPIVANPLQH